MEGNLTSKAKTSAKTENITCSDCGKSFKTALILKNHLIVTHNKGTGFVCDGCSRVCRCRYSLRTHQENFCPVYRKSPKKSYSCPHCPATFKLAMTYHVHQRSSHNAAPKLHKCAICFAEYKKRKLLNHYVWVHEINLKKMHHQFKSMKEFDCWRTTYEHDTNSKYIRCQNSFKYILYACANVTNSIQRYDGKNRHLKIERYLCPSSINAKISECGEVTIYVIETHLGHSTDKSILETESETHLGHSTDKSISETESEIIDEKKEFPSELPEGNPILDTELRDAFRLHTNMYNIDDSFTVDLWIEDLKLNNSVLFYKAEGRLFEDFDELTLDDSVLIIMTTIQVRILQKYHSNAIYIDWNQAMDNYLATILITDDKGEVFPCGFLITNQINKGILKVFLQHVKFKIGMQLCPNVLMTSLDNLFSEAWIEVMGKPNLVWTCPWYVQEDWMKFLNDSFLEYETKAKAYETLRILLNKEKIDKRSQKVEQQIFKKQVAAVLTYLVQFQPLHTFASHFTDNMKVNSITDPIRWSSWNSKLTQKSKTNFENMHKTLKSALWMGQKVNNRVDRTVGTIMRLVRDKSVNLISEDSEEELQNIKELISVNHEKSLEIDLGFVIKTETGGWSVLSSDLTKLYEVKQVKDQCKCEVRCEECDRCLHQYVCSCVDASFGYNMCKHIHLFCRKSSLNKDGPENGELHFSAHGSDDDDDADNSEENIDSSNLADHNYAMTPNQDNRRVKLLADFEKMVDSASSEEFWVIQRCIESMKEPEWS